MTNSISWPRIQFDYSGISVLVTGGTSGIGAAIAQAYKAAGAEVTITGTRNSIHDYDKDLSGLRFLQLEVTDADSIQTVADTLAKVDILINNAGAIFPGGQDEFIPDVFEQALKINLTSAYRLAHALKEKLAESQLQGGASIIGIASMTSFFGNDTVPGYGAAKAGLVQLTKSLAIAWAKHNIRVNAVAAGVTRSNMTAAMLDQPALMQPYLSRTAITRVGEPADIAAGVLFLTSPAASFITGQTLPIDGGYTIYG